MLTVEQIATQLRLGKKADNTRWTACCPAHDDNNPSLSLRQEGEKVLVHCFAGCTQQEVISALKAKGLWHQENLHYEPLLPSYSHLVKGGQDMPPLEEKSEKQLIATYDYFDDDGQTLLYAVERWEWEEGGKRKKSFSQKRPDGQGGWIYKLGDVKRTIYRAKQVIDAVLAGQTIYIVEGEKDVHTAESLGLVATCGVGGAGNWRAEWADYFLGAQVIIFPDNDKQGELYAQKILESLPNALKVNIPKGKDLTDWVEAGATLEDIQKQIQIRQSKRKKVKQVGQMKSLYKKPKMLIQRMLPAVGLSQLFGEPGHCKSFVALDIALSVARGRDYAGLRAQQGSVIYLAGEGHLGLIKRTSTWFIHHEGNDDAIMTVPLYISEETVDIYQTTELKFLDDNIQEFCPNGRPDLIIIDTFARHLVGNESSAEDAMKFLNLIQNHFVKRYQTHVMLVHHCGHMNTDRARGSSSIFAALDAEFRCEKDSEINQVTLSNTKQKDGEQWLEPKYFQIKPYQLTEACFIDEDGEHDTSIALEHLKEPIKKMAPQDIEKFTNKEALLFAIEKKIDLQAGASLPKKEISSLGEELGLSSSSVDRYLQEFVKNGRLFTMLKGHYQLPKNRILND